MSCEKSKEACKPTCSAPEVCCQKGSLDYIIIIVLYILLAIILGACLRY